MVEAALDAWLTARAPRTLLELACGTGLFTRHLARRVPHRRPWTPRRKCSRSIGAVSLPRLSSTLKPDLFSWRPAMRYDAVFFSFWLSHVPARSI